MKKRSRLLAMLMALAMVFAYMPAMVFAEDEAAVAVDPSFEELTTTEDVEGELVSDSLMEAGEEVVYSEAKNEQYGLAGFIFYVLNDNMTAAVVDYQYNTEAQTCTSLIIPTTVIIEGVSYTVTSIEEDALYGLQNLTSVTVPPSVMSIGKWSLGYYYNSSTNEDVKVPGFTIIGLTGTAAQAYASTNGFSFRDPVAEAEAARQGTPDGSIPKVKISKPSTGKKSITVKWKKLTKKQLKKSKATNYEVWVCANAGFASGETSEHIIKKSKAALKIKKVPKGTYFVKVRAIKSIGGVKYVGPWSKIKKVKVKK